MRNRPLPAPLENTVDQYRLNPLRGEIGPAYTGLGIEESKQKFQLSLSRKSNAASRSKESSPPGAGPAFS
jgi:hypothetical protein